jgi:hypothetical protein
MEFSLVLERLLGLFTCFGQEQAKFNAFERNILCGLADVAFNIRRPISVQWEVGW